MLAFAEGQFITAAEVEDVPDVKAGQAVIEMDTEAGNAGRTIALNAPAVEQVTGVGKRLREGVGCEEVQAIPVTLFDFGLQCVVVAVPLRCSVAAAPPKIRETEPNLPGWHCCR